MTSWHRGLVRALGRELATSDAIPRERLAKAERRLGLVLAETVLDFYLRAGAAPELQAHNRVREPEALAVEEGFLVFMEENQNVVDWGIPLRAGHEPDPEVWQRVNGDQSEWYSEEMPFSTFIVKNLAFTRGVLLSDDDW